VTIVAIWHYRRIQRSSALASIACKSSKHGRSNSSHIPAGANLGAPWRALVLYLFGLVCRTSLLQRFCKEEAEGEGHSLPDRSQSSASKVYNTS